MFYSEIIIKTISEVDEVTTRTPDIVSEDSRKELKIKDVYSQKRRKEERTSRCPKVTNPIVNHSHTSPFLVTNRGWEPFECNIPFSVNVYLVVVTIYL